MVLNVETMYLYEYDSQLDTSLRVDVTVYIQVVACVTLFFHCMGFILALANCVIAYNGLYCLTNRVDRRNQHQNDPVFLQKMPHDLFQKEAKLLRG